MKLTDIWLTGIWPVELDYFGKCWDCGNPFQRKQHIKIDSLGRPLHKRCMKRWKFECFDACTIEQLRQYRRTPLLFKSTDKVEITAPLGWELIVQTFGHVSQIMGFRRKY